MTSSLSHVILAVLPLVLYVTASPALLPPHDDDVTPANFLCLKKQKSQGTQLISEKESAGRAECRESCVDQCQLAVYDSVTRACALYTYSHSAPLTLTAQASTTVMVKNGLNGRTCDTAQCYHGSSDSYQGRVNKTVGGVSCQPWASQNPHRHSRYSSTRDFVDDVMPENWCRSGLGESYAPWCYTSDPATRWDYCHVTKCDDDCCHNDAQEETMEALEKSLETLTSQLDDKVKDIEELQVKKSEMKGQLGDLNNDLSGQTKKLTDLQSSISSQGEKVSSLESVMSSLQHLVSSLQSAKTSQEQALHELRVSKVKAEQEISDLSQQLNSLNSQVKAPTQLSRSNCKWTNYVNNWDGQLNFVAPGTSVIVGTDSYHDNGKEDRLWKFYYCQLK